MKLPPKMGEREVSSSRNLYRALTLFHGFVSALWRRGSTTVLQNICDSLRVCLRDTLDLKPNQIQHLLAALLRIILHFQHYGRELALASAKCLINVLNKHPERMLLFINREIKGYKTLSAIIGDDSATAASPEATSSSATEERVQAEHRSSPSIVADSKVSEHKDNDEKDGGLHVDLTLTSYCVKVLYMILCHSDEAQQKLRGNRSLIRSALHRLARCVLNNHPEDRDTELQDLKHFPYSESNANLFVDLCKLLYILDAVPALEARLSSEQEVLVHPGALLANYLVSESTRFKQLFKAIDVQSVEEISIRWQRMQSSSSINDPPSFSSSTAHSSEKASPSTDCIWNPLSGLPALELLQSILLIVLTVSPIYLELRFESVQDIQQNSFYIGKLSDCEDSALMLLLLAADQTLSPLVDWQKVPSSQALLAIQSMMLRKKCLCNSLVRILNRTLLQVKQVEPADRCAALTPILIVLSKLVSRSPAALAIVRQLIFPNPYQPSEGSAGPAVTSSEAAPKLSALSLFAANRTFKATPASSTSSGATESSLRKAQSLYIPRLGPQGGGAGQDKHAADDGDAKAASGNIDPRDCPPNSLRYELIRLMTSLDTQIKRIVAEFVFILCNNNGKCIARNV